VKVNVKSCVNPVPAPGPTAAGSAPLPAVATWKFAVTDCAELIVTDVEVLFVFATFPVQLTNE
jgi:hypothetical protein